MTTTLYFIHLIGFAVGSVMLYNRKRLQHIYVENYPKVNI